MTALEKRTVGSLALLYSFRMLGLFMVLPLLALYAADMPGATPAAIGLARASMVSPRLLYRSRLAGCRTGWDASLSL